MSRSRRDFTDGDIDIHVGLVIRRLRMERRISQRELAAQLGVTHQCVSGYERGEDRMVLSTLWDISTLFDVDIKVFFKGFVSEHS